MNADAPPFPPPPPPPAPPRSASPVSRIAAAVAFAALAAVAAWQYTVQSDALEEQRKLTGELSDLKTRQEQLLHAEREIDAKIAAVPPRPWGAPSAESLESHKKTLVETSEQNRRRAEQVLAELKTQEDALRAELAALPNDNIQPTTKP